MIPRSRESLSTKVIFWKGKFFSTKIVLRQESCVNSGLVNRQRDSWLSKKKEKEIVFGQRWDLFVRLTNHPKFDCEYIAPAVVLLGDKNEYWLFVFLYPCLTRMSCKRFSWNWNIKCLCHAPMPQWRCQLYNRFININNNIWCNISNNLM